MRTFLAVVRAYVYLTGKQTYNSFPIFYSFFPFFFPFPLFFFPFFFSFLLFLFSFYQFIPSNSFLFLHFFQRFSLSPRGGGMTRIYIPDPDAVHKNELLCVERAKRNFIQELFALQLQHVSTVLKLLHA